MSRHQAVRNLDFQNELDEFDGDYSDEDGDGLSPEDRALMTQGTADVTAALGLEAPKVTTAQIEEALWHYYYDVDKSVAYLISKFIDPPKKAPPKVKGPAPNTNGASLVSCIPCHRFFELRSPPRVRTGSPPRMVGAQAQAQAHRHRWGCPSAQWPRHSPRPLLTPCQADEPFCLSSAPTPNLPRPSFAHFFSDMPWGRVPEHRVADLVPAQLPRGGLLGGSGAPPKMSKLQQLAAARKKKAEEKKVEQTRASLNQLSVQDDAPAKENVPLAGGFGKRLKTSESTAEGRMPLSNARAAPLDPERSVTPRLAEGKEEEEILPLPPKLEIKSAPVKAAPSPFAQTLFGPPATPKPKRELFSLPYTDDVPASVRDAFSKPSPDDVVLAAQAKGSLLGKSKC